MSEADWPEHSDDEWSSEEIGQLRLLADSSHSVQHIGLVLGRTANSVRDKALDLGLSLAAANRPPYGDID